MPNERRKTLRQNLAIPVRVQGFLADGGIWEELTTTLDVSYGGACFVLGHEAELGQVLLLSLALPKRLRQFDLTATTYRVYSLVRGVRRGDERPRVGVMFFGKYPPREFQERPSARFLLPTDSLANAPAPRGLRGDTPLGGTPAVGAAPHREEGRDEAPSPDTMVGAPPAGRTATATRTGSPPPLSDLPGPDEAGRYITPLPMTAPSTIPRARASVPPTPVPGTPRLEFQPSREVPEDRRRAPRVQLFVNFTIQLVDEWGAVLQEELTVADNVSGGGARVMTSLGFQVGEVLLLQEAGGGFATRAEVRAITKVQPAVDRLHLRFMDRQAPERLLRS